MPQKLVVHGAAGRMGQRVIALASTDPDMQLVAALDRPDQPRQGQDAGTVAGVAPLGVPISADWVAEADVVIDFSLPEAVGALVTHCRDRRVALVVATTGLDESHQHQIREASAHIPIVWAPSMSMAVNLAMRLAQQAAEALRNVPGGVDIEIIERHHRFKEDAPSGTALKFGELIAGAIGSGVGHVHGRSGKTGARPRNEIGYHAVRTGDNPGEHTIVYGMLGETLELRVVASNRDCYAAGALAAARWLSEKPAGLYSMFDVLGLD